MPKVSVIIPVYNVEKYLRRCLDSVVNQTLKDIEIICVDDGSTDNSLDILKEYAAKDDRLIIIEQENQGAGAARNQGLEIAKGEYIGFCDPDDSIDLNFYQILNNMAVNESSDIAKGAVKKIEEDGVITITDFNKKIINNKYSFRNEFGSAIYSSSILKNNDIKFPENLRNGEDGVFLTRAVLSADKVVVSDNTYYYYYRRCDSLDSEKLSRGSIADVMCAKDISMNIINEYFSKKYDKKSYDAAYIGRYLSLLYYNFLQCVDSEAREICLKYIIDLYNKCLDKKILDKFFPVKWMLFFIKNHKYSEMLDISRNYDNVKELNNIFILSKFSIIKNLYDYKSGYKYCYAKLFNKIFFLRKKSLSKVLVSLTSYPARINTVHKTIESLLNQTYKAEKIILWLSDIQFPNKEKDLPSSLLKLKEEGLEIGWYHQKEDIKPYNKLINTLKKYPNRVIITADDDIIYNKNCIKSLLDTYTKYPNCIIANRAHYITFKEGKIDKYNNWNFSSEYKLPSFNMFLTGVGTVLYPPNCFYKDILNEDLFMTLAKNTDDIWFWAMAVLKGTKIKLTEPNYSKVNYVDGTQDVGLWKTCNENGNNDVNLQKMFKHYPKLLKKLDKDNGFYKNIFERIFSIKNEGVRKVITIFGIKFKFKSKKLIKRRDEEKKNKKINKILKSLAAQKEHIDILTQKVDLYRENLTAQQNIVAELNTTINLLRKTKKEQTEILLTGLNIPKLSVIVPIYNAGKYLEDFLNNLINQTLKQIEIICVDDASTDNSLAILNEFASIDKRIKIISHKTNLGSGTARNTGLDAAQGLCLSFLDADDSFQNNILEKLYTALLENDTDLAICSYNFINVADNDEVILKQIKNDGLFILNNKIRADINVELWNKLFKKVIVDQYNIKFPNTRLGDDTSFTRQYLMMSESAVGINEALYDYRRNNEGIMSELNRSGEYVFESLSAQIYTLEFIKSLSAEKQKECMEFYTETISNHIKFFLKYVPESRRDELLAKVNDEILNKIQENSSAKISLFKNLNKTVR